MEIYCDKKGTNLAQAATGAKATASSCLPGHAIHQIAHLNDGLYGNAHSWIAAGTENEWAQIELPKVMPVSSVVLSRDRENRHHDRMPSSVEIWVSVDGTSWRTVACISCLPVLPKGRLKVKVYNDESRSLQLGVQAWKGLGPRDGFFQTRVMASPSYDLLKQYDVMIIWNQIETFSYTKSELEAIR